MTNLILLAVLSATPYHARVVGISDGDTITCLRDTTQVKVRLWGIDCPESGQDFGQRAKQATSDLAFGKTVQVLPRDTDRYGRTVAEVMLLDGRSLNRELVRQGAAWWYREYAPADRELERLEIEAKAAKRGFWAQSSPVAPWEWRKGPVLPAGWVANRSSGLYHRSTCRAARKMVERNRVMLKTEDEAIRAGYRRAKDCR